MYSVSRLFAPADGWFASEAAVGPVVVVEVWPLLQRVCPGLVGGEGLPVGPAFLEGAVEAFGFAVVPGVAGFYQDMFSAQSGEGALEVAGDPVGEGVVGHDPRHG